MKQKTIWYFSFHSWLSTVGLVFFRRLFSVLNVGWCIGNLFPNLTVFLGILVMNPVSIFRVGLQSENDGEWLWSGTKIRINFVCVIISLSCRSTCLWQVHVQPLLLEEIMYQSRTALQPRAFHCFVLHPGYCSSHPVQVKSHTVRRRALWCATAQ